LFATQTKREVPDRDAEPSVNSVTSKIGETS
jgi:hypothetical protein